MEHNILYKQVEAHVTHLFEQSQNARLIYHNLQHTQKVVYRAKEITSHYNLIETDTLVIYIAAWFHDTGYLVAEPAVHEEKSVQLMQDFMKDFPEEQNLVKSI